jgi:ABC-type glycerol-3-phosphate transport system permease component
MSSVATRRPWPLALISIGFVLIWLFLAAFPYLWTAWGSFKIQADFFSRETWWNAIFGVRTFEQTGAPFTGSGYFGAWITSQFWKSVINTAIVTVSVTAISLTLGTFGGYALARSNHRYKFWILIAALVFRAMPDVTLVSGYLLPFFQLNIWGYLPTAIIVLVAINQPFSLWMLYSFFVNIPKELDESALVDGCSRFQAFRLAIMPVMWPGVITTGLFSFLLAYNDFAVTSMLLTQNNQTMVPKIASFLFKIQSEGNVMFAVAAVVSAIAPLFLLVTFFQKYLVAGLTAGAVKG